MYASGGRSCTSLLWAQKQLFQRRALAHTTTTTYIGKMGIPATTAQSSPGMTQVSRESLMDFSNFVAAAAACLVAGWIVAMECIIACNMSPNLLFFWNEVLLCVSNSR